jgi:ectoine hydroxylase-related dioxygenase (phytanoyl-CoA dioxygenase family)
MIEVQIMQPTAEQLEAYRRDGFVVIEQYLPGDEVERLREHFARCFDHDWETGVRPDEVNYQPGVTPPDRTRQMCNLWKADRTIAATVLDAGHAEFAAALEGEPGMRLFIDNAVWKPANGRALLAHQDATYQGCFDPPNLTTCWMALDDTHADTGTIFYARGSHRWGDFGMGGQFHAPDDWTGFMREVMPAELADAVEWVPIEVPAGGAAFHSGWTFHGSPPSQRADRERRAVISHMMTTRTTWHPSNIHSVYSRYRRPGEIELDEAFFPVMWREDGYRSAFLGAGFTEAA